LGALFNGLPEKLWVDKKEYPINSDHRTALRIMAAFEDASLTPGEKCEVLLRLLYKNPPENTEEAIKSGIAFLDMSDRYEKAAPSAEKRLFSFIQDEKLIYSGIDSLLGGRLSRGELLHWWEFIAAFSELPEDCRFCRVLYYRARAQKGRLTPEERRVWAESRRLFELRKPEEDCGEDIQKEAEFLRLLGSKKAL